MPTVCARECCGRQQIRKDGLPDYHRHFCGSDCKNADKQEPMQAKPRQAKIAFRLSGIARSGAADLLS